jgi:ribosomal protein S18 acetylase RimI-like enzyme
MKRSNLNYKIRPIENTDFQFLRESLYECIYTPEGKDRPSREILDSPELAKYIENWGQRGDEGFIAFEEGDRQPIGAAWYRLFPESNKGYGYVSDDTPELSIAVMPPYRGRGVGKSLMHQLIEQARASGYPQLSLSVDPDNPAVKLYQKLGFKPIGISGTSWVEILELS